MKHVILSVNSQLGPDSQSGTVCVQAKHLSNILLVFLSGSPDNRQFGEMPLLS